MASYMSSGYAQGGGGSPRNALPSKKKDKKKAKKKAELEEDFDAEFLQDAVSESIQSYDNFATFSLQPQSQT